MLKPRRNEKNGDVYVEVEGEAEQLSQFLTWCKKGPDRAIVSNVRAEEGAMQNHSSFEIRR